MEQAAQHNKEVPAALQRWVLSHVGHVPHWQRLPQDAGNRQYYRIQDGVQSWIVMDASHDQASVLRFVRIAKALWNAGINVPEILAFDADLCTVLISDLGSQNLLKALKTDNADCHYKEALQTLIKIHRCAIPELDLFGREQILQELSNFQTWFIERFCALEVNAARRRLLKQTFNRLMLSAVSQPTVTCHRDYHADNLILGPYQLGVVDFQDAVKGPVTYDAVCLLRDARISWSNEKVLQWATFFKTQLEQNHIIAPVSTEQFVHWFDWMGMQVHLKILGVFARLHLRDNKSNYLAHMPRLMRYLKEVAQRYEILGDFHHFLLEIEPAMKKQLVQVGVT